MNKGPVMAVFCIFLIFYFALGFWLIPFFQFQINSDGTALLSVAYAIKAGDLQNSINAYWGLLSPLTIAPFLYIPNIQPIYLMKISSLLTGALGLISFYFLLKRFFLNRVVKIIILITSVPIFLFFAFSVLSSDLLIITLLMGYLALIFLPDFCQKPKAWVASGILGGLLVMTKEYFLYFIVLHLGIIFIVEYLQSKSRKINFGIVKPYLISALILVTISVAWGLVLNYRYGNFMFGARSSFNFSYFSPKTPEYPMFTDGLLKSPNPHGVSIWDEPYFLILPGWSPFESKEYFLFELNIIWKNISGLLDIYNSFSATAVLILLLAVIFLDKKDKVLQKSLITVFIYPLGYIVLSMESRYFWINYILILSIGGVLLTRLTKNLKGKWGFVLITIVTAAFFLSFVKTPFSYLKNYRNVDHTFYDQSKILKNYGVENKKVAANSNWHQTLFISVYNRNKFLGLPKRTSSFEEKVKELEQTSIDYYFSWDDNPDLDKFRERFIELKIEGISNLYIFNIKSASQ